MKDVEKSTEGEVHSMSDFEDYFNNVLPTMPKDRENRTALLDRMGEVLSLFENPQEVPKTIHVAGTTGKGSVSMIISNILKAHGFKVGTHISPHVYDIRERFMIDLEYPDEDEVVAVANLFIDQAVNTQKGKENRPTYYEATLLLAFMMFARAEVDYSIIETGAGGRFDRTNCISRKDKFAVITKLGLDHTDLLGDTIEEIAWHKAGILKSGGDAICLSQPDESASEVVTEEASRIDCNLELFDPSGAVLGRRQDQDGIYFDYKDDSICIKDLFCPIPGTYQFENAALAIRAVSNILTRDGIKMTPESVKRGLADVKIPGRVEIKRVEGANVVFDGAHSPQKMEGLIEALKNMESSLKPIWVVAFKHTKNHKDMIDKIAKYADKVVFSEFFRDKELEVLRRFATPAIDLVELAGMTSLTGSVYVDKNPIDALALAIKLASPGQPIVVSGSIYFLSEFKDF